MLKRWPLFYDLIECLGREMNSVCPILDMVSSLRSKRFQSSYCAKVRAEAKKKVARKLERKQKKRLRES